MKKTSAPRTATADSFQNVAARLGYGTANLSSGAQYNPDYVSRNRFQIEAMYRSSWICGKAVDSVAEDMTKLGIEINSLIPPEEIEALMGCWKDLAVWDRLCDTIKWARLYGGALGVILIDGQNFSTPLRIETVGKGQFKGLMALDRWLVQPSLQDVVKDFGPDMGLPRFYEVVADSMAIPRAKIHYSRVIRIDGQDLPYWQKVAENLWGQSVLERLFDRLLAFDSTTQGAAQLVYKAHLRTYKVEGLRDIIAAGGPILDGLVKQIEFIRSTQTNEGLTLMDTKDEFEAHAYTFGGLDTVLLQFSQQLSGALDIPLTKLFGQSPAGLNSTGEGDIRNYYDGIKQQQERRLRSGVKKLLAITYLSQVGKPLPKGSDFTFRPLWQLSDVEKSTIGSTLTTSITSACTSSIIGRQTALKELRQQSHLTGLWTNITDEDIEGADNDVDSGGEFGASRTGNDDPFGDDKEKTRDGKTWREGDHPRDDDGEFGETGGASRAVGEHGPIFHEYEGKPSEAIEKLQKAQTGEVPGAFKHPYLGDIDLAWGKSGDPKNDFSGGYGLSHIIEKHVKTAGDLKLEDLPDAVLSSIPIEMKGNRMIVESPAHRAIIGLDWKGKSKKWLLSGFERKP